MVNCREALRLSSDPKNRQRSIASAVHSSRDTIRGVRTAAEKAGVTWPMDDSITNERLKSILFPEKNAATSRYIIPAPHIHKELTRLGVNLAPLWTEHCTRFEHEGHIYAILREVSAVGTNHKGNLRIRHKPGDAMQVDWAGNTLGTYASVTERYQGHICLSLCCLAAATPTPKSVMT